MDPHSQFCYSFSGYPADRIDADDVIISDYCGINDKKLLLNTVGYYNGVARFDDGLGKVMGMLDSLKLRENTLIIVLGDHGAPLPRDKATSYEAGRRIPMMVHFPKTKFKGKVASFVSTVDILPTVLDVTKIDFEPKNITGQSWMALLNEKIEGRKNISAEFTQHIPEKLFPQRTISDGNFKLIYSPFAELFRKNITQNLNLPISEYPDTNKFDVIYNRYAATQEYELFDLKNDPNEFENLYMSDRYSGIAKSLKGKLKIWQRDSADPLLKERYRLSVSQEIEGNLKKVRFIDLKLIVITSPSAN